MIDFKEEPKTYNAKVKFSYLGLDESGDVSKPIKFYIGFECAAGTIITNKITLTNSGQIKSLLSVLELKNWEELARKFARIKVVDKTVVAIGNLILDEWVSLVEKRDK